MGAAKRTIAFAADRTAAVICCALTALCAAACSSQQGGQDIAAEGGWYDSLWVSPDGDTALFMYSRYNFFPTILGGASPVLAGPALPGHHDNDANPWDDSDLYISFRAENGTWSEPANLPTNDGRSDCCAMIAGDEMFYQKGTDLFLAPYEDGEWGQPVKLSVTGRGVDSNPHFDMDTQTLYWASDRGGNLDIWQARRLGHNEWTNPAPVPGDLNTTATEEQPFVMGTQMRFSREGEFGNMVAELDGGTWTGGVAEPLGVPAYHAEFSASRDGNTAWFVAADIEGGRLAFMQAQRQPDGSWGEAEELSLTAGAP